MLLLCFDKETSVKKIILLVKNKLKNVSYVFNGVPSNSFLKSKKIKSIGAKLGFRKFKSKKV